MLKKIKTMLIILCAIAVIIIGFSYSYIFVLYPAISKKPTLERPPIPDVTEPILTDHINYLLNEIDAYKLHNIPFTKDDPLIQLIVTDTGEKFTVTVKDKQIISEYGLAVDPDLVISAKKAKFLDLLAATNVGDETMEMYKKGDIKIEMKATLQKLTLKGYKALYNSVLSK